MIDFSSDFGVRALNRLSTERIIWLTTVDRRAVPQTRPVWFLWDEGSILVYSRPKTHKVRHIRVNSHVSINFNSDSQGGNIVVLLGEARILKTPIPKELTDRYVEKYRQGMENLGLPPADFLNTYSVPIKITPTSLRGH
jgi:PPOX class probable F420-dependent enzyme